MNINEVTIPSSKSIANRLLVINALLNNQLTIENLSDADDTTLLSQALTDLKNDAVELYVGNAGTAYRFLTAYLAIYPQEVSLFGNEDMEKRPIGELVDALKDLGASIEYLKNINYPPLKFMPTQLNNSNSITLSGKVSSQYLSALVMIGPFLSSGLEIIIGNELKSESYLKMTIDLMNQLGFEVSMKSNRVEVKPFKTLRVKNVQVEVDWSSASYWYSFLAFGTVGEKLFLKGLRLKSIQGDAVIAKIYESFGIQSLQKENGVLIEKINAPRIDVFENNFSSTPDIVQTIAVTCVGLRIKGIFTGVSHLKFKETDRLKALKNELTKLGAKVIINNETLTVYPPQIIPNGLTINSYQDHRMVMSFAALEKLGIQVVFDDKNAVKKSYPQFWQEFDNLFKKK